MTDPIYGGCLCGGVRYTVDGPIPFMGNCHCSICRKFSGAAYNTDLAVLRNNIGFTGEDLLGVYRFEDRKDLVFCSRCGSSILTTPAWANPTPETLVWLRAGTLDDDPGVRPMVHIYVGSKAPWFEIADDLPQFVEGAG